jgi:SOS-response transcriptional repressor LexA
MAASITESGADPLALGHLIRSARQRKGLTLQDLANSVGCAKSYLSQLETSFRPGSGVSQALLARIELALDLRDGELIFASQWEATPGPVRRELARVESGRKAAADQLRELLHDARAGADPAGLDKLHRSGRLRALIDRIGGESNLEQTPRQLDPLAHAVEVPLINSVTAGYPTDFTDLGYPARIADEYVRVPQVLDPDAFAARVVGDSMTPDYREGDIVVFSPARNLKHGMDCFVRLEPNHESTFKRIFFETQSPQGLIDESSGEAIRLQPLNPRYPALIVPREKVAGLYAAVSVTRMV